MTMHRMTRTVLALATLSAAAHPVLAEPWAPGSGPLSRLGSPDIARSLLIGQACESDRARHCPGLPPTGQDTLQCLSERNAELSGRCLRRLKFAAVIEVCAPDYRRYCPGVLPGAGRVLSCLAGQRDRLSERCGRALSVTMPRLFAADGRGGTTVKREDPLPQQPSGSNRSKPLAAEPDVLDNYEPPDLSDAPVK